MNRTKNTRRARKERGENTPSPPTPLRIKLLTVAAVVGCLLIGFVVRDMYASAKQKAAIERQMQQWKIAYRLNEEQVRQIRVIEIAFHGDGHVLSKPPQSLQLRIAHHRDIAAIMGAEEGNTFLKRFEPQLFAAQLER